MKKRVLFSGAFAVALMVASAGLRGADDSSTATPAPKPHAGRLIKPFSDLKDLSSDQTAKIKEIHGKYLAEIKELQAKDKEECMAVLTDDQKKEAEEIESKTSTERKSRSTTAPNEIK